MSNSAADSRRADRGQAVPETAVLVAAAQELARDLAARAPAGPRGEGIHAALQRLDASNPDRCLAQLPDVFLDVVHELGANEPHPGEALESLRSLIRERHSALLGLPAFARIIESDQRRSGMLAWLLRENVDRLEHLHREMAGRESELGALKRELDHLRPLADAGLLAAGVAHDLKDLLQAVVGHADMARAALAPSHEAAPHVRKTVRAAEHAAELSRGIVRWAKVERGVAEPLDLSALVGEVLELVAPSAPHHVLLRPLLAKDLPMVLADPTDVRRLVLNLVVSAWQAIGEREGEIHIRTGRAEGPEPGTWLEVSDDVRGMRSRLTLPAYRDA